jgi:hypothetical protein
VNLSFSLGVLAANQLLISAILHKILELWRFACGSQGVALPERQ